MKRENYITEYKSYKDCFNKHHKINLLKTIISFYNMLGGSIIIGYNEDKSKFETQCEEFQNFIKDNSNLQELILKNINNSEHIKFKIQKNNEGYEIKVSKLINKEYAAYSRIDLSKGNKILIRRNVIYGRLNATNGEIPYNEFEKIHGEEAIGDKADFSIKKQILIEKPKKESIKSTEIMKTGKETTVKNKITIETKEENTKYNQYYQYNPNSMTLDNWGIKNLNTYSEYERGKYIISSWLYSNFISNSFRDKDLIINENFLKKITEIDFNSNNFKESLINLIYSLRWNNHYSITNRNLEKLRLKEKDYFYINTDYFYINNNLMNYFDNYEENDFNSFLKNILSLETGFSLFAILNFNILFNYWKKHLLKENEKFKLDLKVETIDYWKKPNKNIKQTLEKNIIECKKLEFNFKKNDKDLFYPSFDWKNDKDFLNKIHVELVILYYSFSINFNINKPFLTNKHLNNKNILMELDYIISEYSEYSIPKKLEEKEIEIFKEYLYIKYKYGYVIGKNSRAYTVPGFSVGYYTYLSNNYKEYNEKLENIFKSIEINFNVLNEKIKNIKDENKWLSISMHNDLKLILNNIYNKFYNPYRNLDKFQRLKELKNEFINIILKRNFIIYKEEEVISKNVWSVYSAESIFEAIKIPEDINVEGFWISFEKEFNIDNISHKLSKEHNWKFKSTRFDKKYNGTWNKEEVKIKIKNDFDILNEEVEKVKKTVLSEEWNKNL